MERPRDRENCTGNNKAIRRTKGPKGMNWTWSKTNPLPSFPSAYVDITHDKSKYYIRLFILPDVSFNPIVYFYQGRGW